MTEFGMESRFKVFVLNGRCGNSFLLVLDAHTFQETGRAEVPHHIPFGFHGLYTPEVRQ